MNKETYKYTEAVAVVMRNPQGLIYLSIRKNTETWKDCFAFAGGRIDPDDFSSKYAAHREVYEETGLFIGTTRLIPLWNGSTETANYEYIYLLELRDDEIPLNMEPSKHGNWELYTIEEARKMKIIPVMLEVFDALGVYDSKKSLDK